MKTLCVCAHACTCVHVYDLHVCVCMCAYLHMCIYVTLMCIQFTIWNEQIDRSPEERSYTGKFISGGQNIAQQSGNPNSKLGVHFLLTEIRNLGKKKM